MATNITITVPSKPEIVQVAVPGIQGPPGPQGVPGSGGTGTVTASSITDATAIGRTVITSADATAVRSAIGAGTSSLALGTTGTTAAVGNHTHTPASIGAAAASHTHAIADLAATGTKDTTTFLRGDGTWAVPSGGSSGTTTSANITDATVIGRTVLTSVDATAVRTAIGAGTSSLTLGTTSTTALAGNYAPTKTTVGLANVDNTADTAKPVSTAQQTALDLKANLASPTFTGTVNGITKAMVGLGSVDNTADTAKPVSTAQASAIALKATALQSEGMVTHDGTTAGGTRPTGFYRVRWVGGTTRPTNMAVGDIWEIDA